MPSLAARGCRWRYCWSAAHRRVYYCAPSRACQWAPPTEALLPPGEVLLPPGEAPLRRGASALSSSLVREQEKLAAWAQEVRHARFMRDSCEIHARFEGPAFRPGTGERVEASDSDTKGWALGSLVAQTSSIRRRACASLSPILNPSLGFHMRLGARIPPEGWALIPKAEP